MGGKVISRVQEVDCAGLFEDSMSRRTERVSEQLRSEIARLLLCEVTDPRIGLLTLTQVEVAADLTSAKILWSVLDPAREDQLEEIELGLESATGFLRKRLAEELPLRRIPQLHFRYDPSLSLGSRTLEILKELGNDSKK